jgi:hypothetical protein
VSIILAAMPILRPHFCQLTTRYELGSYGRIFGVVLVGLG